MKTHTPGLIILILLTLAVISGFVIPNKAKSEFTPQVPTPSWPQATQPRCGLAMLSMLAAEVENETIQPNQWGLPENEESDTVSDLFLAYQKKTGRVPVKVETEAAYNIPYIWIGHFQGGSHICLCYFQSNSVTLKHGVYDLSIKTNMMTVWDFPTFYTNTIFIYKP